MKLKTTLDDFLKENNEPRDSKIDLDIPDSKSLPKDYFKRTDEIGYIDVPDSKSISSSEGEFDEFKKNLIGDIEKISSRYNEFLKQVSPKYWRGSKIRELGYIINAINNMEPISDEEKNSPFIKKLL